MRHLKIIIVIFIFSIQISNATDFIKNGLSLNVSPEGMQVLGDVLHERFFSNLNNAPAEDIELTLPLVGSLEAKGISVSTKVSRVGLKALNGGLELDLDINELNIHIERVVLRNYFLPFVASTCEGLDLKLGNGNKFNFHTNLGIKIVNGKTMVNARSLDAYFKENQFKFVGPTACYGPLGFSVPISAQIISSLLNYSRPLVNYALKNLSKPIVKGIGPVLVSQIERLKFGITIPSFFITEQKELFFQIRPINLSLDAHKGMDIDLSLRISENTFDKSMEKEEGVLRYATFKFHKTVLNEILDLLFKGNKNSLELTADFNEMVDEILKTHELSMFLPDLNEVVTDTEQVRAFLKIKESPVIDFDDENKINLKIPNISLLLKIKKDGKWIDYFTVDIKTEVRLDLFEKDTFMELGIKFNDLKVIGNWAKDYKPIDSTFNDEDFKETLKGLVGMLTESGDSEGLDMNLVLPVGGHFLSLKNILVEKPYLLIDFVPAPINAIPFRSK